MGNRVRNGRRSDPVIESTRFRAQRSGWPYNAQAKSGQILSSRSTSGIVMCRAAALLGVLDSSTQSDCHKEVFVNFPILDPTVTAPSFCPTTVLPRPSELHYYHGRVSYFISAAVIYAPNICTASALHYSNSQDTGERLDIPCSLPSCSLPISSPKPRVSIFRCRMVLRVVSLGTLVD